ncbi:MAG TPA: cytochrome c oxidase assembly factor Coa1 family protein [Candidatus Tumulicola sp.]|nr:cytochrome c oxidase assembly factor Coa1 family protein [Candidatus Tumulicola sp.]
MEPSGRPRDAESRVVWIVVGVVLAVFVVTGTLVGLAVAFGFTLFRLMDRTPAHVCGLAAVRSSPIAAALVGTPIEQRGFTGGSSSSENGELNERITFTVAGPRGSAFVRAEGRRSPLDSHLEVRIGRNGRSAIVYSGPFDCPELHAPAR